MDTLRMKAKRGFIRMLAFLLALGLCSCARAEEKGGNDAMQEIFTGVVKMSGYGTILANPFTLHVGGQWDAAQMNPGCAFRVEYAGPEYDGVQLALISHSGGNRWATILPDERGITENGLRYALFGYDTIVKRWGANFARLDEIRVLCAGAEPVTLYRLAYVPGQGDPVDTSDGAWDVPDTGIAFLGDSIVQNVYYNHGDWNTLLGRKDCVNYGIGAQTTVHCLNRIDELARKHYRQLVLLCGINDLGYGYKKEDIVDRVAKMFDAMRAQNPDMRFVIISVLPTNPPFFQDGQGLIVTLDADLKAYADAHADTDYVDCYSGFVGEDGYCREGLTLEGLHPNAAGYAIVAERLKPYLLPEE